MKFLERSATRKTFLNEATVIFGIFLLILGFLNLKTNEYNSEYLSSVNVTKEIWKTKNNFNTTEKLSKNINRKKRVIIFNGGGVVKLVLGVSFPIQLADRMRSLSYFYNLQLQYTPPPIPLYWWSFFNTSTFPGELRRTRQVIHDQDISRQFIYLAIENAFDKAGLPGTQCLLQTICEIARSPFYVPRKFLFKANWGIYHELLNTIFTPKYPNVNFKYLHAHQIGVHGAVCNYKCSKRKDWLEQRSLYV